MEEMSSDDKTPKTSPSSSQGWKDRVFVPTLFSGFVGGIAGLVSKHRRTHGAAKICSTYAANSAIVGGCYCGVREFVAATRGTGPGDLMNSAVGGFASGALLGRLQGGQIGAIKYSIIFAILGTTVDFTVLQLNPLLHSYKEFIFGDGESKQEKTGSWLRLPDWSPIQVLDEEALAAKHAREQLYAERVLGNLNKEKP